MKKLFFILLFSQLIKATVVDRRTIPFIDQVIPLIEEDLSLYQNPLFFTDIDEVLITVDDNKMTSAVEGIKTREFFKRLNTLVADRKQNKDFINNPCFGLTARFYIDAQFTENELAGADFYFSSVFNEKDYSKASIGISFGVPFEIEERLHNPQATKEEIQKVKQEIEDKVEGTIDTIGFYHGVVYTSHINKRKALVDVLNKLKEHGPDPDFLFFIDDQKKNIDGVVSLFTEPDIKKLAAELGVKEDLIIGLRVSVKKIILVHYTYVANRDMIHQKYISDISNYCNAESTAMFKYIAADIGPLIYEEPSSFIDQEKVLQQHKKTFALFKDLLSDLLVDYSRRYQESYGSLPAFVVDCLENNIGFYNEHLKLIDDLLQRIKDAKAASS